MATPSSNISLKVTTQYETVNQRVKPTVGPADTVTGSCFGSMRISVRPASVSSPVRADGSRAPRPWSHRWGNVSAPYVTGTVTQVSKTSGSVVERRGSVPAYRDIMDGLQASGAEWIIGSALGFPLSVEASARTKALAKLADGKADLGATLGELRQTARGVTQVANQIVGGVEDIVNGAAKLKRKAVLEILRFGKPRKPRRGESPLSARKRMQKEQQVLDSWMQYQMAIQPTIGDIDRIGRGLSDELFEQNRSLRVTVKAGAEGTVTGEAKTESALLYNPYVWDNIRTQCRAFCHISAVYEVPRSGVRSASQWGLANPAAVAWELTAFSWLVDYVVGVGGWLESLSASNGTRFIEGSITKYMRVSDIALWTEAKDSSSTKFSVSRPGSFVNADIGRINRSLLTNIAPSIVPPLRKTIGLTQMANAITALTNLVRK